MTKEYMVEEETVCPACAEAEAAEDIEEGCPVCPDKHTVRSDEDRRALLSRLKRIEGQVRGLHTFFIVGLETWKTATKQKQAQKKGYFILRHLNQNHKKTPQSYSKILLQQ